MRNYLLVFFIIALYSWARLIEQLLPTRNKQRALFIAQIFVLFAMIAGCSETEVLQEAKETSEVNQMKYDMMLTSPAFPNGMPMPSKYTCQGEDLSPRLEINYVPENAKSLVLIMDDPDAPALTWDHWVVFDIPANTKTVPEGTEPKGVAGKNSWERTGYGGPCPPSGKHRYFFKLYALDTELNLPEGSSKAEVEKAMEDHIIAKSELVGLYQKK